MVPTKVRNSCSSFGGKEKIQIGAQKAEAANKSKTASLALFLVTKDMEVELVPAVEVHHASASRGTTLASENRVLHTSTWC